ncbi:hypothetical protein [Deinococcus aluminii]|uniref:Uncharacterized protein n=1 Tax=Deinococcus aluminii TaxID=1656885 RepID=A0ABP9XBL9_9DEIO
MNRSSWVRFLTLWGGLWGTSAVAASPGFVSYGFTLPLGVRADCNQHVLTISVNGHTWQHPYEGENPETKIVLEHYLLLDTINSGSLTFFISYLFDLRSRQKIFETDMTLLYEDRQRIVLMPSGVSIGHWRHLPEIGIFNKGDRGLKMYRYSISPRPACGSSEDDVFAARDEDFIGSAKGFSFVRSDNCGRFVVSKPWPPASNTGSHK